MNASTFNIQLSVPVFLLLLSGLSAAAELPVLVDNVLAVQLDKTCDPSDVSNNFIFSDGGEDFFKEQFGNIQDSASGGARSIHEAGYSANRAPSSSVISSAVSDIQSAPSSSRLENIHIVLGDLSSTLFCYDGTRRLNSCPESLLLLFDKPQNSWDYRYDCDGWKAIFTSVVVGFRGSQFLKVVLSITLRVQDIDINQCPSSTQSVLQNTTLCPPSLTQCEHQSGAGFKLGSYLCRCRHCASCPATSGSDLLSPEVDAYQYILQQCKAQVGGSTSLSATTADPSVPVPPDVGGAKSFYRNCPVSRSGVNCTQSASSIEVYVILGIQGICVLGCVILAIVVFVQKSTPVIQSAKCLVLELVLFGAMMIYGGLLLMYFPASNTVCYLRPWLRELGFTFMYGAIMLKTYKFLAEFQTRKARRVHIRDKDLLKYWLCCLGVVVIYLAGWTAININYQSAQGLRLYSKVNSNQGGYQWQCAVTGWNYVTELAELLFIAFGIYMSSRLFKASAMFWECRFYAAVLIIEFIVSLAFYVFSPVMKLNLYWMFIASFGHSQLTITIALLLIFGPKLHYMHSDPKESQFIARGGNTTDLVDFRTHRKPGATNGDVDFEEVNIAEMDPDEVRKELRHAYEQLQTLKVKVMRYENPHLQSKRGNSKSKLPFYKQISKHGSNHKKQRGINDIDETTEVSGELQPLNSARSTDNTDNSIQI